jgi:histidinol-phosphatase (PHP family)
MYKENYHTHMRLCHHAEGNIEDYVLKAISLGFTRLGISDHGPIKNPGFPRMSLEEFKNEYITEFKYCKNKYKNIHLYLGLEMEYFYGMDNYYKELLKDCDYLI